MRLRSADPVRVKKAEVMSTVEGYPLGVTFSDHYPVMAVLVIR